MEIVSGLNKNKGWERGWRVKDGLAKKQIEWGEMELGKRSDSRTNHKQIKVERVEQS